MLVSNQHLYPVVLELGKPNMEALITSEPYILGSLCGGRDKWAPRAISFPRALPSGQPDHKAHLFELLKLRIRFRGGLRSTSKGHCYHSLNHLISLKWSSFCDNGSDKTFYL